MPGKVLITTDAITKARMKKLHNYVNEILSLPSKITKSLLVAEFFGQWKIDLADGITHNQELSSKTPHHHVSKLNGTVSTGKVDQIDALSRVHPPSPTAIEPEPIMSNPNKTIPIVSSTTLFSAPTDHNTPYLSSSQISTRKHYRQLPSPPSSNAISPSSSSFPSLISDEHSSASVSAFSSVSTAASTVEISASTSSSSVISTCTSSSHQIKLHSSNSAQLPSFPEKLQSSTVTVPEHSTLAFGNAKETIPLPSDVNVANERNRTSSIERVLLRQRSFNTMKSKLDRRIQAAALVNQSNISEVSLDLNEKQIVREDSGVSLETHSAGKTADSAAKESTTTSTKAILNSTATATAAQLTFQKVSTANPVNTSSMVSIQGDMARLSVNTAPQTFVATVTNLTNPLSQRDLKSQLPSSPQAIFMESKSYKQNLNQSFTKKRPDLCRQHSYSTAEEKLYQEHRFNNTSGLRRMVSEGVMDTENDFLSNNKNGNNRFNTKELIDAYPGPFYSASTTLERSGSFKGLLNRARSIVRRKQTMPTIDIHDPNTPPWNRIGMPRVQNDKLFPSEKAKLEKIQQEKGGGALKLKRNGYGGGSLREPRLVKHQHDQIHHDSTATDFNSGSSSIPYPSKSGSSSPIPITPLRRSATLGRTPRRVSFLSMYIRLKIVLDADHIVVIRVPKSIAFQPLVFKVQQKFNSVGFKNVTVTRFVYQDEEGHVVTVADNDDCHAALEGRSKLTMHVLSSTSTQFPPLTVTF